MLDNRSLDYPTAQPLIVARADFALQPSNDRHGAAILVATQSMERIFALHWSIHASEVWDSNIGIRREDERCDIDDDPSHGLDGFWTPDKDGFLLLAFPTFVVDGGEAL